MTCSETSAERHFVVADVHGRPQLFENALAHADENDARLVSAGDLIGGPDTRAVVELALGFNAVCLYGNHEWALASAMGADDPAERARQAFDGHRRYFSSVYPSYGLDVIMFPKPETAGDAIFALKHAISEESQADFFRSLKLYYQTGSFLTLHAGVLPNKFWEGNNPQMSQKAELDEVERQIAEGTFDWKLPMPVQIGDNETYSLSSNEQKPPHVRGKVLITGHFHTEIDADARVTGRDQRVALAGPRKESGPLYGWQSWDGVVVPILAK